MILVCESDSQTNKVYDIIDKNIECNEKQVKLAYVFALGLEITHNAQRGARENKNCGSLSLSLHV